MATTGTGFVPVRVNGQRDVGQTSDFWIANADSVNIFKNDMAQVTVLGQLELCATVADGDSGLCVGSFNGCEYTNTDGQIVQSHYYPATQSVDGMLGFVYTNPQTIYSVKIQSSGVDTTSLRTVIAACVDNEDANAGSTTTGLSAQSINIASVADAGNHKIVGLHNPLGSDSPSLAVASSTTYTHALVIISPNLHYFAGSIGNTA